MFKRFRVEPMEEAKELDLLMNSHVVRISDPQIGQTVPEDMRNVPVTVVGFTAIVSPFSDEIFFGRSEIVECGGFDDYLSPCGIEEAMIGVTPQGETKAGEGSQMEKQKGARFAIRLAIYKIFHQGAGLVRVTGFSRLIEEGADLRD